MTRPLLYISYSYILHLLFCFDTKPPNGKSNKLYCRFKFHHVASTTEPTLNRHPISSSQLFSPLFWFSRHCIATKSLLRQMEGQLPRCISHETVDRTKVKCQASIQSCVAFSGYSGYQGSWPRVFSSFQCPSVFWLLKITISIFFFLSPRMDKGDLQFKMSGILCVF